MDHTNEVVRTILTRRSYRQNFTTQEPDVELLREIVRCGCAAPSSKNAQPWRFHVVRDRSVLRQIADAASSAEGADTYVPHDPTTGLPRQDWESTVQESAEVLRSVPVGIFVENKGVFSRGRQTLISSSREVLRASIVGYTLEVLGIGTAIENLILASNGLGIQCAFMGDIVIAEDTVRSKLKMEGDFIGVVALGYSNEDLAPRGHLIDIDDPELVVWR